MSETVQFYLPPAAPIETDAGPVTSSTPDPNAPRDFRENARNIAPRFLSGPIGERFLGLLGLLFDALAQGTQLAVTARQLFSPTFAADALKLIGSERMLPRYLGESLGSYHNRLHDAWKIWRRAGSEAQILEQLELAVGASFENAHWTGDGFGDAQDWSHVWLVARPGNHPWTSEGTWGDGQVWGDGGTWGSNASVAEIELARALVELFRPAHWRWSLVVQVGGPEDEAELEPGGAWNRWRNRSTAYVFWTD